MLNQGMTVTSGCRCKANNKNEGGVDTSFNICEGKAATALDFTCNNMQSAYNLACFRDYSTKLYGIRVKT